METKTIFVSVIAATLAAETILHHEETPHFHNEMDLWQTKEFMNRSIYGITDDHKLRFNNRPTYNGNPIFYLPTQDV